MNSHSDHIEYLWNLYRNDEASDREIDELLDLLDAARRKGTPLVFIEEQMAAHQPSRYMDEAARESMLRIVLSGYAEADRFGSVPGLEEPTPGVEESVPRIGFFRSRWLRYAAAILILLGTGVYLRSLLQQSPETPMDTELADMRTGDDAMPGADKAILTLADGSTIMLDSASDGQLAKQGNVQVLKTATGELAYSVSGGADKMLLNTMRTPRGGQYRLTLSDGTRVWLNAASSITYPAAFSGPERAVSITGEAYFEVARDQNRPFRVSSGGQQIEVLGTSFNVNAYADEPFLRSTLVEGRVQLSSGEQAVLLTPGQQAFVENPGPTGGGANIRVRTVDTMAVTAWKNGLFNFNEARLTEAMRQLSRWYDVEVSYEGAIPDLVLMGEMQRSLKLSQVLTLFQKLGVEYRMENRELFIVNR